MKLEKNFLTSSPSGLSLKDYRRLRKICDDAHYYVMHPIDDELCDAGISILREKLWGMRDLVFSKAAVSGYLRKSATILDHYKRVLEEAFEKKIFNDMTLRIMKIFSDIAFYANDPEKERYDMLLKVKEAVQKRDTKLQIYDFVDIEIPKLEKGQIFNYHPALYSSSVLYRLSELGLYKDVDGTYYPSLGDTTSKTFNKVYLSLDEIGSFNIFDDDSLHDENGFYLSLGDDASLTRNRHYRVVLDEIAQIAWSSQQLSYNLDSKEQIMLSHMIGKFIDMDYLVETTDNNLILDPNIHRSTFQSNAKSLSFLFSDYAQRFPNIPFEKKDFYKKYSDLLNQALSTKRIVYDPFVSKLNQKHYDVLSILSQNKEVYMAFLNNKNIWNQTKKSKDNNYSDVKDDTFEPKNYNDVIKRHPDIKLVDGIELEDSTSNKEETTGKKSLNDTSLLFFQEALDELRVNIDSLSDTSGSLSKERMQNEEDARPEL